MSLLSTIGKDVAKVFTWLGSPKGQAVVAAGEAVVGSAFPAADGIIGLSNTWLTEIIKTEALATAAGQQNGSGTTKAAIAISTITPELLSFLKANNFAIPDAAKIQTANAALVTFLNVFSELAPVTTINPIPAPLVAKMEAFAAGN